MGRVKTNHVQIFAIIVFKDEAMKQVQVCNNWMKRILVVAKEAIFDITDCDRKCDLKSW